ncbi:hypothetical protein, partial [Paenibacillus apiarius]|uniref:hypothetical protein n=1 Tax=Paenibacillus apiarius TaxID=46240 RepID=UPI003B3B89FB
VGVLMNDIYVLNVDSVMNVTNINKRKRLDLNLTYLWHCRLGHINEKRLSKLHKDGLLDPLIYESYKTYEACLKGKMAKTPFVGQIERVEELLGLIHSDVCGPMSISARGGYSYFITFTDDYSRYGHVFLMKHMFEALEKFIEYKSEVEKQTDKSIKVLRSYRGGESLS